MQFEKIPEHCLVFPKPGLFTLRAHEEVEPKLLFRGIYVTFM